MNRTVMILATCGYILQPVKNALRENGILFHNPYNVKRGDWNPLGKGAGAESVLAYTGPAERLKDKFDLSDRASLMRLLSSLLWNHDELEAWLDVCAVSSFMPRGAKVDWLAAEPYPEDQGRFRGSNVAEYFNEESDLVSAANADLNWLAKHLKAADAKRLAYVIEVAKRHGPKKLKERPRVILGTIHSVKGGQADVVYVFPDASEAGRRAWDGPQIDEVIRQFYVAFTRAREELVLCPPATRVFIPLP
jgi:DNA helicase II / ATP-dependent DNA helicase PcrA